MSHSVPWLDQDQPHEEEHSRAQIAGVLTRLAPRSRVLDVGCGGGRVLKPLSSAGHDLIGIDIDLDVLGRWRNSGACGVELINLDFRAPGWHASLQEGGPFDAILVLGNTFMLVWNVIEAVRFLAECRLLLRPGGEVMLDDISHDLWPLLAEGDWTTGLSEQGALDALDPPASAPMQLIWDEADAVFAIRVGDDIDTEQWEIKSSDTRYRLWTMGALTLAARAAGLSAPVHDAAGRMVVLQRPIEA